LKELDRASYNDINFIDVGKSYILYYHNPNILLKKVESRVLEDSVALYSSLKFVGSLVTGFRYS
jgi:hypothetical protein